MRRLATLLALLALAGCGGDGAPAPELPTLTVPSTEGDPDDAMRAFVDAAAEGRANEHLTEEAAARGLETELAEGVGTFAGTDYRVLVEELWDDVAIVAIAGEREVEGTTEEGVFAAPLVREDGLWKVDVLSEPRLEIEANGVRVAADEVRMWVDGIEVDVVREGDSWRPAEPLAAGDHALVAAARRGEEVSALAWKGVVGPPP